MKYNFKKPIKCNFQNLQVQDFSLPAVIIRYLIKNDSSFPGVLEKLFKTCKYFYLKFPVIIIDFSVFGNTYWPALHMSNNITSLINFKAKFWFTDVLKISFPRLTPTKRSPKPPILMTDDSVKWMSTIVEKTYRFDTEYLLIAHTYIKLSDFKILTSSDVLDVLTLSNSAVFDSDGNDIPIDILLQRIPNVTSVNYHRPSNCPREIITNSTMINLTNQNSLRYFNIKDFALSPTFDIQLICTFIKKNAAKKLDSSKASFFFNLIYHSWEQKNQFTQAIKEMLQEWTSKETKPNVYIT